MKDDDKNNPLCPNAWAIPPSPRMIEHNNVYYTCSLCGEPVDTPKNRASQSETHEKGENIVQNDLSPTSKKNLQVLGEPSDTPEHRINEWQKRLSTDSGKTLRNVASETGDSVDFNKLYDLIDGWYHEQTRHHLVDVDPDVMEHLFKPLLDAIRAYTQRQVLQDRIDELVILRDWAMEMYEPTSSGRNVVVMLDNRLIELQQELTQQLNDITEEK